MPRTKTKQRNYRLRLLMGVPRGKEELVMRKLKEAKKEFGSVDQNLFEQIVAKVKYGY